MEGFFGVTLKEIDYAPNAEAGSERDYECLQYIHRGIEKCHIVCMPEKCSNRNPHQSGSVSVRVFISPALLSNIIVFVCRALGIA